MAELFFGFLFPFIFLGVWGSLLFLFIKLSRWDRLATQYGYRQKFRGKIFRLRTARIGAVRYRNAIDIGISDEGLYLKPFILFRLNYPPVLIPWGEISHCETYKEWWINYYSFDVGFPVIVNLKLPPGIFENYPEIVARLYP